MIDVMNIVPEKTLFKDLEEGAILTLDDYFEVFPTGVNLSPVNTDFFDAYEEFLLDLFGDDN